MIIIIHNTNYYRVVHNYYANRYVVQPRAGSRVLRWVYKHEQPILGRQVHQLHNVQIEILQSVRHVCVDNHGRTCRQNVSTMYSSICAYMRRWRGSRLHYQKKNPPSQIPSSKFCKKMFPFQTKIVFNQKIKLSLAPQNIWLYIYRKLGQILTIFTQIQSDFYPKLKTLSEWLFF